MVSISSKLKQNTSKYCARVRWSVSAANWNKTHLNTVRESGGQYQQHWNKTHLYISILSAFKASGHYSCFSVIHVIISSFVSPYGKKVWLQIRIHSILNSWIQVLNPCIQVIEKQKMKDIFSSEHNFRFDLNTGILILIWTGSRIRIHTNEK